jgi:nitrogen fixation/metabolism regulation signal transduction histidine kinase
MGFERFGALLTLRLASLLLALGGAGYLLLEPGYPAATALALGVSALLAAEVFRFVRKTNLEISRFLDAARYGDFGQRFEFEGSGAGFPELGATFTEILDRFREDRQDQEAGYKHLKAILEHVPVPLITLQADRTVRLLNNAARKLFGSASVRALEDLAAFGADLPARLELMRAGDRELVKFHIEGTDMTLAVVASEITVAGASERLLSLMNIQSELDGMQLEAWQDLVRVLTHEIMNSITPVSSLARTASDLVSDVRSKTADSELAAELDDVQNAVSTVARRSDGLMSFVSSYRQLTRLPTPVKTRFELAELVADVERLGTADWEERSLRFSGAVEPERLSLHADRQMITQVLLNLLQNAAQAIGSKGTVRLTARLNARGHVAVEVTDDGPGIAPEVASKIFVPFYTTRQDGSGVGLAFSRQVMLAHGGTITFTTPAAGGSSFTLTF